MALAKPIEASCRRWIPAEVTEAYLQKTQPSAEHARVLRELSAQTDRLCCCRDLPVRVKPHLLQHVETLQHSTVPVVGSQQALLCLAPTHTAVKEIRARGLVGQTLDRFLLNYQAG